MRSVEKSRHIRDRSYVQVTVCASLCKYTGRGLREDCLALCHDRPRGAPESGLEKPSHIHQLYRNQSQERGVACISAHTEDNATNNAMSQSASDHIKRYTRADTTALRSAVVTHISARVRCAHASSQTRAWMSTMAMCRMCRSHLAMFRMWGCAIEREPCAARQ